MCVSVRARGKSREGTGFALGVAGPSGTTASLFSCLQCLCGKL